MLQASAVKVPRLSEEATEKYQSIAQFTIGPHAIHLQVRHDPDKKWLSMCYKVSDTDLETMLNDWPVEWCEPVSTEELSTGPLAYSLKDMV